MITQIVIGSTFKGVIVGALVGWFATRTRSVPAGVVVGLAVGAFFAFLIAAMPNPDGTRYYWQIMLPGSVLGMIVGYATQRYGRPAREPQRSAT